MSVIRSLDVLAERAISSDQKAVIAVVWGQDKDTLESCLRAQNDGLAEFRWVGDGSQLKQTLEALGAEVREEWIVPAGSPEEAAKEAVALVRRKEANALMKGQVETGVLLKSVVDKEAGIGTGKAMTHIVLNEVPTYPKLMLTTDGGMMTYPTFEQKISILENAVDALRALGYAKPKAAVLAAVEKVNPKMPETVDAAELKKLAQSGRFGDCVVEGPISYDLAFSKEICKAKKYDSEVGGDADIFMSPDIVVGNILGKSLIVTAKGRMAGVIVGAAVPIILTSRGSTPDEKYYSIALSALI